MNERAEVRGCRLDCLHGQLNHGPDGCRLCSCEYVPSYHQPVPPEMKLDRGAETVVGLMHALEEAVEKNKREKVRVCPTCKRDGRTNPMPGEIGSWSGERLWRCERHGVFYARDFT